MVHDGLGYTKNITGLLLHSIDTYKKIIKIKTKHYDLTWTTLKCLKNHKKKNHELTLSIIKANIQEDINSLMN